MSLARCSFCSKLPAIRSPGVRKSSRCPLCKGELLTDPASGTISRLADPGEPVANPPPRSRAALALGVGALAAVALGIWALPAGSGSREGETFPPVQFAQVPVFVPLPVRPAPEPAPVPVPEPARRGSVEPVAPPDLPRVEVRAQPETLPAPTEEKETPRPNPLLATLDPLQLRSLSAGDEAFRSLLAQTPEVDLEKDRQAGKSTREARTHLAKQVEQIKKLTDNNPDGFVLDLKRNRADLAGLPFLLGKDCVLDKERAKSLDGMSRVIRESLDTAIPGSSLRPSRGGTLSPGDEFYFTPHPGRFWSAFHSLGKKPTASKQMAVPALRQMLAAQHPQLRLSLVEQLQKAGAPTARGSRLMDDPSVTVALARLAVFDLEPGVRALALETLKGRPADQYRPILLDGLRYPWAPVAERAAEGLARLNLRDTIPELVRLLDQPDPNTPFLKKEGTKEVPVVREMVRINHFRNCLLCHAPAAERTDLVRGVVPVPGEPIPSSSVEYYAERRAGAVVRADITYLRQDFSLMQPVSGSGDWPILQRYDFLVRTRLLTKVEQAEWETEKQAAAPRALSDHKRAILFALRELTGQFLGTRAADWQSVLRQLARGASEPEPIRQERRCVK
ncbi:MAG: hypothetical protein L0Z62_42075 [Gemmataceae bacterium]|nr:hypothetical protein [Gemmataceae bacterium]